MVLQIPQSLARFKQIELAAGTHVFKPGDNCQNFFYLLEGSIRVDMLAHSGRSIMLYRFGAGETCVLTTACLFSQEKYSASATVEASVKAIMVSASEFQAELVANTEFRDIVFKTFALRMSSLMSKIDDVAFTPLDIRLATRLLELTGNEENIAVVTHEQLALDIGSAREVVSRRLKAWEKKNWVVNQRGLIKIIEQDHLRFLIKTSE